MSLSKPSVCDDMPNFGNDNAKNNLIIRVFAKYGVVKVANFPHQTRGCGEARSMLNLVAVEYLGDRTP